MDEGLLDDLGRDNNHSDGRDSFLEADNNNAHFEMDSSLVNSNFDADLWSAGGLDTSVLTSNSSYSNNKIYFDDDNSIEGKLGGADISSYEGIYGGHHGPGGGSGFGGDFLGMNSYDVGGSGGSGGGDSDLSLNYSLFSTLSSGIEGGDFLNVTTSSMDLDRQLPIDMTFNGGHLISIITYSFLLVLSAMGNLTVLAVIVRRRKRSTPYSRIDFMLLHLCVADLIVTFFMMPLEIAWAATVEWKGGDFLCRIMAFFRIFGLYLSSLVLVCLALDRYLAVKYPMQVLRSARRGKAMITFAWIISIVCSLPQVYIFHLESHPNFPWYTQCVTFGSLPANYDLAYRIVCLLMMYALPFVIIILLYCGIVLELFRQTRESSLSQSRFTDGLRRSGIGNLGRAREKTLKMTVAIVVVFFICWTPYQCMCLWYMIDKASAEHVDHRIQKALFLFACTNSTANPVVYGIFHLKATFTTTSESSRAGLSRESLYRSPGTNSNTSGKFMNGCRGSSMRGSHHHQGKETHLIMTSTSNRCLSIHTSKSSSSSNGNGNNTVTFADLTTKGSKRLATWNNNKSSFC